MPFISLPGLFWLISYDASHHLAVVPHSDKKYQFYCIVYYTTLSYNCEAKRVSKNMILL